MRKTILKAARGLAAAAAIVACTHAGAADTAARDVLLQALQAQGGEQRLRALKSVAFEAAGYRHAIEQSERPQGPYLVDFLTISELHLLQPTALHRRINHDVWEDDHFQQTTTVAGGAAMLARGGAGSDGVQRPGTAYDIQLANESIALSPERLLLTALDAADAHLEPDQTLHDLRHRVVVFTLDGSPVRLYLNASHHLPSAYDYGGPLARVEFPPSYSGDATQRTTFGLWRLHQSGIRFPMLWSMQLNGQPDRVWQLRTLKIDQPVEAARLAIPDAVRSQFNPQRPFRHPGDVPLGGPIAEIAPGVVFIPGQWNTAIVDQGDGLVILEAPISSAYSVKVLDEAARRFPGKPVKAVVSTSDSWPHLAGIREYAARGIPIYALDLNAPIIERTLKASYTQRPDTLQASPRAPQLRLVHDKLAFGEGVNRLELYPLQGPSTERNMMAYFPQHRLLYGSDPFQKAPDGSYYTPETVSEVVRAVTRERLPVERFFLMHMELTPYSELLAVPGSPK